MTFNPHRYEYPYGIQLLDDIHNIFPEVMYDTAIFGSIPLVPFLQNRVHELFPEDYVRNRTMYRMYQQTSRRRSAGIFMPSSYILPPPQTPPPPSSLRTPSAPIRPRVQSRTVNIPTSTIPINLNTIFSDVSMADITNAVDGNMIASLLRLATLGLPVEQEGTDFLTPVAVCPTQEQLDAATFLTSIEPPADVICSICQSHDLEDAASPVWRYIRHCNHQFHKECIDHWFEQNVHCPVCRFDIRDHTSNTE